MEEKDWLQVLTGQNQLAAVIDMNAYTERFGLALTEEEAAYLVQERQANLRSTQRVEFGGGILPRIIFLFCDSSYIDSDNYVDTLARLQEIFYQYKNESMDRLTDDELLHFMKEQFEAVCYGDLEYLEETCLANFAAAVRSGYEKYRETDGYGAYAELDEVPRWDKELYLAALRELGWDN